MKLIPLFLLLICITACKDKYDPDIHLSSSGLLVVEGFINAGTGSTTISLSRTTAIDHIAEIPEPGAQIEVQSENGTSYPLSEDTNGNYSINQLSPDPSQKYRVHIKTSDGKEYLSDFSEVKKSPPIDSVGWKAGSDQLMIYVSTHDDQNKSLYYQWNYEETWIYNSAYDSKIEFNPRDSMIFNRPNEDLIHTCWKLNQSTEIILGSTTSLSSDVVFQFPLLNISYSSSNRLVNRYSILVEQKVLTKDWYEWKQMLKKNTEELGSIFDAQPSETGGNFHCISNPSEQVIGFVGCSSISEKRIFIDRTELPSVRVYSGYEICTMDTVPNMQRELVYYFGSGYGVPVMPYEQAAFILGSSAGCVDCRVKGGTTVKPDFWH
ncbi:MAG TPA: DUF4249 domain-containing protein [Puia sp.]|nr:DUF4249 domain-containing protein [Puia sp.]